jgi:hypothetical protein
MDTTPLFIELFCGTGALCQEFSRRGWHCCGVDIRRDYAWPPEIPHLEIDIHSLTIDHREINSTAAGHRRILLWASPPCQEYSLAARRPPGFQPDTTLWRISTDLAARIGCPYIIENASGAQRWHGPAAHHFGKVYLWGSGVPPLLPQGPRWKDRTHKSQHSTARLRAVIPSELVQAIADFHSTAPADR